MAGSFLGSRRNNCTAFGNEATSSGHREVDSPDKVGIFDRKLKVERKKMAPSGSGQAEYAREAVSPTPPPGVFVKECGIA